MGSASTDSSTHLPPPLMMESTDFLVPATSMLCWSCAMCFSAAASSENDHGSMNLASKTAPVSLTSPSSVAAIQGIVRWIAWRWMSPIRWPEFSSYQRRLRSSVTRPSWTIRTAERSGGDASPRFSSQSRNRAFSSLPMMMR